MKEQKIDAFSISVPPDKHMDYAHYAFEYGIHCFIEASVVDDNMKELINKSKTNKEIKICPSCTLRFHPAIKLIKKIIETGEIGGLSHFSYHSGQYLPDWHPWEKVTDYYVGNKETGGCREIVPFELTWLNWVFGDIEKISGFKGKTIELGADIDDVYCSAIKYKNGVLGTLVVDVVSRYAIRKLVINGSEGQIQWDWNKKCVEVYYAKDKRWVFYFDPEGQSAAGYNANIVEEMYIEEIRNFIDAINGIRDFSNSLEEDYELLQDLYDLERSNR